MDGMLTALILSLAWFAAFNAVVSLAIWMLATRVGTRRGARSADALLAIRLLPFAVSTFFVTAIFMPAHWRFEPRGLDETFGIAVYLLAAAGALLILRSLSRVASVARAGWHLRACTALPRIASEGAGTTEVFEVPGLAGVSLAGVVRPRILVGPAVRHTLTEAELDAAVAHEMAHRAAGDNVKRFVMFCAPDFVGGSAAAQAIESQWRAAAEWQADERAVGGDTTRAINLASALVKVARLATTAPARLTSPAWSTLHDAPLLQTRVQRLVAGTPQPAAAPRGPWLAVALALAAAAVAAGSAAAANVHQVTETMAHLLP